MAYRRKRRSRGTWFPTFGFTAGGETTESEVSGVGIDLTLPDDGSPITEIKDLTYDYPHEPVDATNDKSLEDIIGNEYLLQRIVGKAFVQYNRGADNDATFSALCAVGFFVARAEGDGNSPIGTDNMGPQALNASYSPLAVQTMREPWIWRRTWILQDENPANTTASTRWPAFPRSTAGYGSVQDGPHIDSKIKRRIGQDDRLYVAFSAIAFPPASRENANLGEASLWLDYRIFGSLRKAKNRSAF